MREIELIESIKKRVNESVKDLMYPTADKKLEQRAPKILDGFFLPDEGSAFSKKEITEIAPFILVRPKKGSEIELDQFQVEVEIIIQIHDASKDYTGHQLLLSAMNRIRANIFENQILDNLFVYDGGFTWEIPNDQPVPNWEMSITSRWLVPNTQWTSIAEFT